MGHVLIIDDEEVLLRVISAFAQIHEHTSYATEGLDKNLEGRISTGEFTHAILDQILVGKTGLEIAAIIREKDPSCLIYVHTGEANGERILSAAKERGEIDHYGIKAGSNTMSYQEFLKGEYRN